MKPLGQAVAFILVMTIIGACQNKPASPLPTRIALATFTPSAQPNQAQAPTLTPTEHILPSATSTLTLTPTPTTTYTATLTATPTPTRTPSLSATPTTTPSATFSATPSPTATPEGLNAIVTAQALNIRNGPGDEFDVIAHLEQGAVVPIVGTDEGQKWLLIEYENGLRGWLHRGFVDISGDFALAPNMEPTPLPEYVKLDGLTHLWQQLNNCAPTALTIALTYYGVPADPNPATEYLRPSSSLDVSVDIQEMVDYVNENAQGLRAIWRLGGNWTVIRKLVAAGFPVLIETGVLVTRPEPGWAGHNRVIIGYDESDILTYDSYLGHGDYKGFRIAQDDLDEYWRQLNRHYMVIYPIEREADVAYIIGEDWLIPNSIDRAHRVAEAELAAKPNDAFAFFNLGATYVEQGQYAEAAAAYDAALELGNIPFRIFWYQFGIFEAYYNLGRYNDVIDQARRALLNMGGNGAEEIYYWLGMGYAGRGEFDKARVQFENAIAFNPRFRPAQAALEQIRSGTFKPPV